MDDIDPCSLLEISLVEEGGEQEVLLPLSSESESVVVEADPLALADPPADEAITGPLYHGEITLQSLLTEPKSTLKAHQQILQNAAILSQVSPREQIYRHRLYATLNIVLKKRLHCTICDTHVGCSLDIHDPRVIHPLLKVLICIPCSAKYSNSEFILNPDGTDLCCRWCGGSTSTLRRCVKCPYAFCEDCIYRNFPLDEPHKAVNWECFVCKISELWPHRALSWALVSLLNNLASRKVKDPIWSCDISECCRKLKQRQEVASKPPAVPFMQLNNQKSNTAKVKSKVKTPSPSSAPYTKPKPQQRKENKKSRTLATSLPKVEAKTENVVTSSVQEERPSGSKERKGRSSNIPNGVTSSQNENPPEENEMEVQWLKAKVESFAANINAIHLKLLQTVKNIGQSESVEVVREKLLDVNALLLLGRTQLQNYQSDLEKDWASRKTSPGSLIQPSKKGPPQSNSRRSVVGTDINKTRLTSNPRVVNNYVHSSNRPDVSTPKQVIDKYKLKSCKVTLERCSLDKDY